MNCIDFGYSHLHTYRRGEAGYYLSRPRGSVEIWRDDRRYIYHPLLKQKNAREFRRFMIHAWDLEKTSQVQGRWPSYTIL